ncbi:MAG: CHAT domain-containing protein, partial [Scytonema sp. PMC 1069.18]|nr:CHAT domain-containing protein [Scytonema sp. PMC 1069.18]
MRRGTQELEFRLCRAKINLNSAQRQAELVEVITFFADSLKRLQEISEKNINRINNLAQRIAQGQENPVLALLSVFEDIQKQIEQLNEETSVLIAQRTKVVHEQKEALRELELILLAMQDIVNPGLEINVKELDSREQRMMQLIENAQELSTLEKKLFGGYFADVIVRLSFAFSLLLIWVIKPSGEITFCQVDVKAITKDNISLSDLVVKACQSLGIDVAEDLSDIDSDRPSLSRNKKSIWLQNLNQVLIQPIVHLLSNAPNNHLIFIPQGILFLVPFAALQDTQEQFLVEKFTVVTAPSIQALELIQKRSTEVPTTSLEALVVGNPITDPPAQLEDLAWAKTEAQAIAPLLNTQAITGADATKAYITQLLPKARLIHFATHGLLDDIRQLGIPGAIALAPFDEDNGFLTAG